MTEESEKNGCLEHPLYVGVDMHQMNFYSILSEKHHSGIANLPFSINPLSLTQGYVQNNPPIFRYNSREKRVKVQRAENGLCFCLRNFKRKSYFNHRETQPAKFMVLVKAKINEQENEYY